MKIISRLEWSGRFGALTAEIWATYKVAPAQVSEHHLIQAKEVAAFLAEKWNDILDGEDVKPPSGWCPLPRGEDTWVVVAVKHFGRYTINVMVGPMR